jgi:NDP-sugar pyrophosphorylase family protein
MKAMLLTAGVGQRMLPLTLYHPKPIIPVLGRPIVVQTLHWLRLTGVDEATLNLHHLPQDIRRVLGDGEVPGLPTLHYSHEEQLLGTAGGIRKAAPLLRGDGPIIVCNSDFLSDIDLDAVLDAHQSSDNLATLVFAPWRPGYTVVERDATGRVLSLGGDTRDDHGEADGEWLFTGCQIIEEELIDRIPAEGPSCIVRDVYRPLLKEGRVGSVTHEGFWWEFGTPELYLEGCMRVLALPPERLAAVSTDHDPIRSVGTADVAVGPAASLHPDARIVGHAALGTASHVAEEVLIENSVIGPGAWIGPGCWLRRAVICESVELPAGFIAEDELICVDHDPTLELPPSTRRESGMLRYGFGPADAG